MQTIPELLPEFIEHIRDERQLSETTIKAYTSDLTQVYKILGHMPFDSITVNDLRRYIRVMKQSGYSPASIRRRVASLSTFYKFQRLIGNVEHNHALTVHNIAPRKKRKVNDTYLTPEQWRRFVFTEDPTMRNNVAWKMLGWLGLRGIEIQRMKISDVSLESGMLTFTGKGGHRRRLPIADHDGHRDQLAALIAGRGMDDFLFPGDQGGQWSRQSFTNQFDNHLDRAGLPGHITPHWLRHTVATMLSQVMTIHELKEWLGHRYLDDTVPYIHHAPGTLKDLMKEHPLNKHS